MRYLYLIYNLCIKLFQTLINKFYNVTKIYYTFKEIKERSPHLAVDIGNLDYNRQLTSSILERKDRNLKEIE
jgi:hypothetical protein